MREFKKLPLELFIGYDIEQNSRVIELDASEMVEKYPSGILQLVCKRPGEETTYIAPSFEQDGGTLRWTLTSYDVEKAGQGLAIVALVDTSEESVKVLASHKIRTGIEEGLHFRDAEKVDPDDSLIARVLAAVSQAQAYAQDAKKEADRAEAADDAVEDARDQAITAIEAKGQETLDSIPSDYTALLGDVSDLKSEINYILTPKSEVDADSRKDKWYIRDNGTIGFSSQEKGGVINCKGNTCYRLVDAGNAQYVGIGCANTTLALDLQLQKWKTDNSVLDIITPPDAIRLFYYTEGNFEDLTIYEMQVVDKSAQVELAELKTTTDALNSAVVPPAIFTFENSGNNTVMMDLDVNHTYIIENALDSLSDVVPRAYMGNTKIEDIVSSLRRGSIIEYTPSAQADSIRFYCASSGARVSIREKNTIYDVTYSVNTPLVKFKYSGGLKDVSAENSKMDWVTNNAFDILPQVYALFDALVTDYPDYVTKVDAATEMSMSYPEYANGIETAGEYMVTPQYKTYMYKFIDTNANAGNGVGGNTEKKKIFIYGAEHGNEVASAFNCYLLANELCTCTDEDIFALRAGYDIYILPCLNGYGMYHRIRGNGNLVNINRNFPVLGWTKSGENTKTDVVDALNQYTGDSAGSEFETQLIIALINNIKPNVIIDHHNYGSEKNWQFYVESVNAELVDPMYRSLVDCSIAFKKAYPMYFGSGYGLLIDDAGSLLEHVPSIGAVGGMSYRWAMQNGYYAAAIVEISKCINYLNGVPTNVEQERFSDKAFSIGLYTLENTLKRICEYEAKKVKMAL